jgi:hypothetical protein
VPAFRVVYAGSLYGARRPEPVLAALAAVAPEAKALGRPIEVVVAGQAFEHRGALEDAQVQVDLRGYLAHRASVALVKSADLILVLIGTDDADKHAPSGKLYEAVAAGPPVLAWAPEDGEAARVLAQTGAGVAAQTPEALEAAVRAALAGRLPVRPLADRGPALEPYDRRTIARRFAAILAQLSFPA